MIRLLVLSHTEMHGVRFCTNVAGRRQDNHKIVQFRPHVAPNEALQYHFFGSQVQAFRDELRPGSMIEIERFSRPALPRITHPEDIIVDPAQVWLVRGDKRPNLLQEYADEMAFDNFNDLFPGMFKQSNGKVYRPDGEPNDHSVGYVRAQSVTYYTEFDKLRGRIVDVAGNEFTAPVKGVDLLVHHPPVRESLVRLSLAGGFSHENWAGTNHPSRCFLMLSHVIEL